MKFSILAWSLLGATAPLVATLPSVTQIHIFPVPVRIMGRISYWGGGSPSYSSCAHITVRLIETLPPTSPGTFGSSKTIATEAAQGNLQQSKFCTYLFWSNSPGPSGLSNYSVSATDNYNASGNARAGQNILLQPIQ